MYSEEEGYAVARLGSGAGLRKERRMWAVEKKEVVSAWKGERYGGGYGDGWVGDGVARWNSVVREWRDSRRGWRDDDVWGWSWRFV